MNPAAPITLIRGGRLIDPAVGIDEKRDLLLRDGRVAEIGAFGRQKSRGSSWSKWYICYMAVLNLRGIPNGLVQTLKADAALAGVTLRDHCVRLLAAQCPAADPRDTASGPVVHRLDHGTHNPLVRATTPSRTTIFAVDEPDPPLSSASCPDCGSVGSTHQRWCQR